MDEPEKDMLAFLEDFYSTRSFIKAFIDNDNLKIFKILCTVSFDDNIIELCIRIAIKNHNILAIKTLINLQLINSYYENNSIVPDTLAIYSCTIGNLTLLKQIMSLYLTKMFHKPITNTVYCYLIYIATMHNKNDIIAYLLYLPEHDSGYNKLTYNMFEMFTPFNLIKNIIDNVNNTEYRFILTKLKNIVFDESHKN